jgi:pimeloyl-ACP methyl ester carboxylesterase
MRYATSRREQDMTPARKVLSALVGLVIWLGCPAAWAYSQPEKIQEGNGEQTAYLDAAALHVFTYRPAHCTPGAFLIVFHGVDRNAGDYRNFARSIADHHCYIVAAPLFDKERFPRWRYQYGGLADGRTVEDSRTWTGWVVLKLVDWLRQEEGRADMPYFLIGHSAGAQFLDRFAAVIPNQARRIVVANPSTYMLPSVQDSPPYGFSGLDSSDTLLKRYLAQPLTIFLGQMDRGSHNLARGAEADEQGETRLDRGENVFRQAEAVARQRGWPFNWRLVEAPDIGHNAKAMFASPKASDALGLAQ